MSESDELRAFAALLRNDLAGPGLEAERLHDLTLLGVLAELEEWVLTPPVETESAADELPAAVELPAAIELPAELPAAIELPEKLPAAEELPIELPATHSIAEFFILRKYRRQKIGAQVARQVFERFPGRWQVAQMTENLPAQHFWRTVIAEYTGGRYEEVPAREMEGIMQVFDTP